MLAVYRDPDCFGPCPCILAHSRCQSQTSWTHILPSRFLPRPSPHALFAVLYDDADERGDMLLALWPLLLILSAALAL